MKKLGEARNQDAQRPRSAQEDKLDAIWLAKLHARGMLRSSFLSPVEIRQLRDYTRLRADLTGERSHHIQRVENFAKGRLLVKNPALIEALTGRFDEHHGELAGILLAQIDSLTATRSSGSTPEPSRSSPAFPPAKPGQIR